MFSVSHTTRKPRAERGRRRATTTSSTWPAFSGCAPRAQFAEWAEVHGNLYGTALSEIERCADARQARHRLRHRLPGRAPDQGAAPGRRRRVRVAAVDGGAQAAAAHARARRRGHHRAPLPQRAARDRALRPVRLRDRERRPRTREGAAARHRARGAIAQLAHGERQPRRCCNAPVAREVRRSPGRCDRAPAGCSQRSCRALARVCARRRSRAAGASDRTPRDRCSSRSTATTTTTTASSTASKRQAFPPTDLARGHGPAGRAATRRSRRSAGCASIRHGTSGARRRSRSPPTSCRRRSCCKPRAPSDGSHPVALLVTQGGATQRIPLHAVELTLLDARQPRR